MIKDLGTLFERICMLSTKPVEEYKVFFEDWKKVCNMSDFETVLKAWEEIKIENTFYFQLKIWHDKLDFLEEKKKIGEDIQKKSKVERDDDMIAWRENSRNFRNGKITVKEYLGTAIKIRQMTMSEADKEFERYKRLEYNFNKPITNTGVMSG